MPTLNIKGFPDELYKNLGQRAKSDRRSLSSEVIYLLEWALKASQQGNQSIMNLRGLGKDKWNDIQASKHVETERDAWD